MSYAPDEERVGRGEEAAETPRTKARKDATKARQYAAEKPMGSRFFAPFGPGAGAPKAEAGGMRRRGAASTTAVGLPSTAVSPSGIAMGQSGAAAPTLGSPPGGRRKRRLSDAEGGAPSLMSPIGSGTGERSPASAGSDQTRPLLHAESRRQHRRMPTGQETGDDRDRGGFPALVPTLADVDEAAGVGRLFTPPGTRESSASTWGPVSPSAVVLSPGVMARLQETVASHRTASRTSFESRVTGETAVSRRGRPGARRDSSITARSEESVAVVPPVMPAIPPGAPHIAGRQLPRRSRPVQATVPMATAATLTSPGAQDRMNAAALAAATAAGVASATAMAAAAATAEAARRRRLQNRAATALAFLASLATLGFLALPGPGGVAAPKLALPRVARGKVGEAFYAGAGLVCTMGCALLNNPNERVNVTFNVKPAPESLKKRKKVAMQQDVLPSTVRCSSTFYGHNITFNPANGTWVMATDVAANASLAEIRATPIECDGEAVFIFDPTLQTSAGIADASTIAVVGGGGASPSPELPSNTATATATQSAPPAGEICVDPIATQPAETVIGEVVHLPGPAQVQTYNCATHVSVPSDAVYGNLGISAEVGPNGALPLKPANADWKCSPPPPPGVDAPQDCVVEGRVDQVAAKLQEAGIGYNTGAGGTHQKVQLVFGSSGSPLRASATALMDVTVKTHGS